MDIKELIKKTWNGKIYVGRDKSIYLGGKKYKIVNKSKYETIDILRAAKNDNFDKFGALWLYPENPEIDEDEVDSYGLLRNYI